MSDYSYKTLLYNSPCYIHSHVSFFSKSQAAFVEENEYLSMKADDILQQALAQVEDVDSYLKTKSEDYEPIMDMLNGRTPRSVQVIIDNFNAMRRTIAEINEIDTSEQLEQLKEALVEDDGDKTLVDVLGDSVADALLENLGRERKRVQKLQGDSSITLDAFRKIVNIRLENNRYVINQTLDKQLNRFNKDSGLKSMTKEFKKLHEEVENYVENIKTLVSQLMSDQQIGNEQLENLNKIKTSSSYITQVTSAGKLKELISYLRYSEMAATSAVMSNQGTIDINLVGTSGHEFTSDIMMSNIQKDSSLLENLGITIKSSYKNVNGTRRTDVFDKTTRYAASRDDTTIRDEIEEEIFRDEQVMQYLRYLIVNYQALSTFAIGYKDKSPVDGGPVIPPGAKSKSDVEAPTPEPTGALYPEAVYKLRASLGMVYSLKALLGSMFMNPNFSSLADFKDFAKTKGIPLILDISDKYYWTYQLLDVVIEMVKKNNMRNLISMFDMNSGWTPRMDEDKLYSLYIAKKITESSYTNRYDDIVNNDIDGQYEELADSFGIPIANGARSIMASIAKPYENDETIRKIINSNRYRFYLPITDYIH